MITEKSQRSWITVVLLATLMAGAAAATTVNSGFASLSCYSCSTAAGDVGCSEDAFDKTYLSVIKCPEDADVCVRVVQLSDSSSGQIGGKGSVFRSCGQSNKSKRPEKLNFGFYPILNSCEKFSSVPGSAIPNATFEICSCTRSLSNVNGAISC